MSKINVNVDLVGLDNFNGTLGKVEAQVAALRKTVAELNEAALEIGIKINQPTDTPPTD